MKHHKFLFFLILLVLLAECSRDNSTGYKNEIDFQLGNVSLNMSIENAPLEISYIEAILYKTDLDTLSMFLSISGQTASGTFFNIQTGLWNLTVNAFDDNGNILYTGSTLVVVTGGQTSIVNLRLQPTSGSIEIHVTWGCIFEWNTFNFTEYGSNPIVVGDTLWNYKTVIDPTVIYNDGIYKMWFAGRGSTSFRIGYGTSEDGINWEIYSEPVLIPGEAGEFDESSIRYPNVIEWNGGYRMWYAGNSSSGSWQIGTATSNDGINWIKGNNNPVIPYGESGAFDDGSTHSPNVVYKDGIYYMLYDGGLSTDLTKSALGLAISNDGENWEKYSGNPVFSYDNSIEWESSCAGGTDLIVLPDGKFEMLYLGRNDNIRQTGRAWSEDCINWERDPSNPVILIGEYGSWNQYSSTCSARIFNNNTYQIWFNGQYSYSTWSIGYGTATISE